MTFILVTGIHEFCANMLHIRERKNHIVGVRHLDGMHPVDVNNTRVNSLNFCNLLENELHKCQVSICCFRLTMQ